MNSAPGGPGGSIHLDLFELDDGDRETVATHPGTLYRTTSGEAMRLIELPVQRAAQVRHPAGRRPRTCVEATTIFDQGADAVGAAAYVVCFPVPTSHHAEFDEWFCEEHAPMLLENDDWMRARLTVPRSAEWSRVAVHSLSSLLALDSPERQRAGRTALAGSVLGRPWAGGIQRFIAEPLVPGRDRGPEPAGPGGVS